MSRNQRVFTRDFKLEVCKKIKEGLESKTHMMRTHKLGAGTLERWIEQYEARGPKEAFDGNPWRAPEADSNETRLRKELEQLKLENEFLKACLGKASGPQQKR